MSADRIDQTLDGLKALSVWLAFNRNERGVGLTDDAVAALRTA